MRLASRDVVTPAAGFSFQVAPTDVAERERKLVWDSDLQVVERQGRANFNTRSHYSGVRACKASLG
jgi:hypothetical protein